MKPASDKLKRYLLGDLATAEIEHIDRYVIEEPTSETVFAVAESQLIEDFLEGELDQKDTALFHSNFLTSNDRYSLLRETQMLKSYSAQSVSANRSGASGKGKGAAAAGYSGKSHYGVGVAMIGLILFIFAGLTVWRLIPFQTQSPLERQYAAINQSDFSDPKRLGQYSQIELYPGKFRGLNGGNRIADAGLSEDILFVLPLGFEPRANSNFKAEVTRNGVTICSIGDLRLYGDKENSELRVVLPKSIFEKGPYQISLTQPGAQTSSVVYSFSVE